MEKTKGKCYSKVNRGQRKKGDMYQTPYSITEKLLDNELFFRNLSVLEPAAGEGAIVRILEENFEDVAHFDIEKDGKDFLTLERRPCYYIITNPPFSLANEFIVKAKKLCLIKFAFLMPLNYLQGVHRHKTIFSVKDSFPLKRVHVFTRMPTLTNEVRSDGKYSTGMQALAWYVWERTRNAEASTPTINWINNQPDILRKERKRGKEGNRDDKRSNG